MAEPKFFTRAASGKSPSAPEGAPLGGTRAEAIRRVQVGVTGLFAMVLVMGVASAISNRAKVAEEAAVPDAAPTTEPTEAPAQVDPLVDAGVVPAVPAEGEGGADTGDRGAEGTTIPDIEPTPRNNDATRTNAQPRE